MTRCCLHDPDNRNGARQCGDGNVRARISARAKRLTLPLIVVVISSCSAGPGAEANATQQEAVALPNYRRLVVRALPEWERNITNLRGATSTPIALRAGSGLAVSLHAPSIHHWKFPLADSGRIYAGGPHYPRQWEYSIPIYRPADVVGVSDEGIVWILDQAYGRVVGEDVGGRRSLVASFGIRETVHTACAPSEHTIAFLDDARPQRILLHDVRAGQTRSVPMPDGFVEDSTVRWDQLRFGGASGGPCVIRAPWMTGVIIVSDSMVSTIDRFVEPILSDVHLGSNGHPTDEISSPLVSPIIGALDVTGFPGGVAVLFKGRTAAAGRLVDLYSTSGEYLETMLLPRRTLRIAGTSNRIVALSASVDSVYLASYILPARIRLAPLEREASVIAPSAGGTN